MIPPLLATSPYQPSLAKLQPLSCRQASMGLSKSDQTHFGAHEAEMPFTQNRSHPTAGTLEQPVSSNNCLVCSAKNLLAYFGYPKASINNVVQDSLQNEIKNRQYFKQDSPYYQQAGSQAIELNNDFVRAFMTSSSWGLNMAIEPLRIHQLGKIKQAITDRKALWIFAEGDKQTLAANARSTIGGPHQLTDGHAYVVIPDKHNPDAWLVLDSWAGKTRLNSRQLIQNLDALKKDGHSGQSQYNIVHRGPDPELMSIYLEKPIPTPKPLKATTINRPSASKKIAKKQSPKPQKAYWAKQWWSKLLTFFRNIQMHIRNWYKRYFT